MDEHLYFVCLLFMCLLQHFFFFSFYFILHYSHANVFTHFACCFNYTYIYNISTLLIISSLPLLKVITAILKNGKGSGYFAVNGNLPSETILP